MENEIESLADLRFRMYGCLSIFFLKNTLKKGMPKIEDITEDLNKCAEIIHGAGYRKPKPSDSTIYSAYDMKASESCNTPASKCPKCKEYIHQCECPELPQEPSKACESGCTCGQWGKNSFLNCPIHRPEPQQEKYSTVTSEDLIKMEYYYKKNFILLEERSIEAVKPYKQEKELMPCKLCGNYPTQDSVYCNCLHRGCAMCRVLFKKDEWNLLMSTSKCGLDREKLRDVFIELGIAYKPILLDTICSIFTPQVVLPTDLIGLIEDYIKDVESGIVYLEYTRHDYGYGKDRLREKATAILEILKSKNETVSH